jgi:hypothetical protein
MPRPLALLLALALAAPALADDPVPWKAGAARVAITPTDPIWMAGYAARTKPSQGKMHDLWAKALAFEDPEGSRALLVTLDLCGIDREFSLGVRKEIERRTGLAVDRVALAVSHTHSGPVLGTNLLGMYPIDEANAAVIRAYTERLAGQIADVAVQAVEALAPARITWETGRTSFAVNRRENPEGQVPGLRDALALKGPVDHDVPVLKVERPDGELLAAAFGYACHCTTLDGPLLSGDYAGFAQIAVEEAHPGAIALFWAGCGADQNPIPRRQDALAEQYGKQLAGAVESVLARPMHPLPGPLAPRYAEIDLAFAPLPDRAKWEEEAKSDQLAFRNRAKEMLARLDRDGSLHTTYPYPVQAWRFGPAGGTDSLAWVFLGGEVTVDYALRLKRNLGPGTWVAAYSNDVMAYIPSLRVLKEGGYEGGGAMVYYGQPAPWSEQVEEQVIEGVRSVLAPK